jgi:hypothetical protein
VLNWLFEYPGNTYFECDISLRDALDRLTPKVTAPNFLIPNLLILPISTVEHSILVGRVAKESVILHRARPGFVYPLKPYFRGRFFVKNGKPILEGTFGMSPFVKTGFSLFFGFLIFCGAAAARSIFVLHDKSAEPFLIAFPCMLLLSISFIWIGKFWSRKDVEWISDQINKALAPCESGRQSSN